MSKVTLKDIAGFLGLSRVTVSKVINGREGVAEHTRERVLQALVQFNYKNYAELSCPRTVVPEKKSVAIFSIAPDFSEFWLAIIRSVSRHLEAMEHQATYFFLGCDSSGNYKLPEGLNESSTDGIIVLNVYDHLLINQISALNLPAVYLDLPVNRAQSAPPGDTVFLNGMNVFRSFTQAFLRQGIRRPGFVGDIGYAQTIADRWSGFRQGLERFGLKPDPRYCHTGSMPGRYYLEEEIADLYTSRYDFPEAVLCANDAIAKLVAARAEKFGLQIGRDLLLTGFDGLPLSAGSINLTTAFVDTEALGTRLAMQLYLNFAMKGKVKEQIFLEPEIIVRESSGKNFQV